MLLADDPWTSVFDTSEKHAIPGWTDRVLFQSASLSAVPQSYRPELTLIGSDHRPVSPTRSSAEHSHFEAV